MAEYIGHVKNCLKTHKIHQALFVGGSGFYIQALEKGLYPEAQIPETLKEALKKEVEAWIAKEGMASLYLWVKDQDPLFADSISEQDHYRVRRAVELMKTRGITMTEIKKEMGQGNRSPLGAHQKN